MYVHFSFEDQSVKQIRNKLILSELHFKYVVLI